MQVTVALLQMTAHGTNQQANLLKGEAFCRRAQAMGADIALFPEMWNIGYTPYCESPLDSFELWQAPERWKNAVPLSPAQLKELAQVRERWQARAISRDDLFIQHFRQLAKELDMALALTYLEKWPGAPRNAVSLIDRHGELRMTYAKVHTCDFGFMEYACTPGDDFFVSPLDTKQGTVHIGAMICYDREFPESARILMLKGAELILTPNACELEMHRLGQFRTRATENMVGVAMANYAAPQQNGHSIAFDPIAFNQQGSRDTLIIEAGEGEGIYLATFDMDAIRDYRVRETWGNAFRKPDHYSMLTSLEVKIPFIRANAGGELYDRTRR